MLAIPESERSPLALIIVRCNMGAAFVILPFIEAAKDPRITHTSKIPSHYWCK
jgi:hypothetical protein